MRSRAAVEFCTPFLHADRRIKMLTPAVERLFNVTDSDVFRPIADVNHGLAYDGVEPDARAMLRTASSVEDEIKTRDGRWLMTRPRLYRAVEDRIAGIVLSFVNITQRR